jgi:glycogen operon protein
MWLDVDGTEMSAENWDNGFALCLGMMVSGDTMDVRDAKGNAVKDDTFLILFNAYHERMNYVLPGKQDVSWELLANTEQEAGMLDKPETLASGDELDVCERSLCILRLVKGTQAEAYSVSWKRQQKAEPTAPPTPLNKPGTLRDATTVTKTTAPKPKEKAEPAPEKPEATEAKPEQKGKKAEAKAESRKEAPTAEPEKPEPPAKG